MPAGSGKERMLQIGEEELAGEPATQELRLVSPAGAPETDVAVLKVTATILAQRWGPPLWGISVQPSRMPRRGVGSSLVSAIQPHRHAASQTQPLVRKLWEGDALWQVKRE